MALSKNVRIDFEQFRVGRDGPTTLPANRFTSREFLELEYQKLWPFVWQLVCREDEVPKVGDYLEYQIGEYNALIIRSDPSTIKALSNACLHRGRQLREGRGTAKELRCAAHSWRYHLDGSIKEVVDVQDYEPSLVERSCLQLPEYKLETWNGWVFINFDRDAGPLKDFLKPMLQLLDFPEMAKWPTIRRRTTIMRCNWKMGIDAFRDIYHLSSVHPQSQLFSSEIAYSPEVADSYKRNLYRNGHGNLGPAAGEPRGGVDAMPSVPKMSPRLGTAADPRSDIKETIRGMLAALVEVDDFFAVGDQATVDAMVDKLAEEYPRDASDAQIAHWWAQLVRKQQAARGLDLSRFTDDQLMITHWAMIFPHVWVANCGVMGADLFTFRPNGMDPDSCVFEEWFVGLVPDSEARKEQRVQPEVYGDFHDNKRWGRFLTQDLGNVLYMQKGIHNPSMKFMRLGEKDDLILHGHTVIDQYLTK